MKPFRVMTFNVRGSLFEIDGENVWERRAALNIATIRRYLPDLIGMQEVQSGNLAAYTEHLPEYGVVAGLRTVDQGDYFHHNAIYYNRVRFRLMTSGAFYLSSTPEVWSRDWDSALVRSATWCRFRDLDTGHEFIHLNVHLDHIGEEARVNGARLVLERAQALRSTLPVIFTGDFNSPAWKPASMPSDLPNDLAYYVDQPAGSVHGVFTGAGCMDTFIEAGHHDSLHSNSFHGFEGEHYPQLGMRIDWILTLDGVHRVATKSCRIIRDAEPPLYPSDHYPVLAELVFA